MMAWTLSIGREEELKAVPQGTSETVVNVFGAKGASGTDSPVFPSLGSSARVAGIKASATHAREMDEVRREHGKLQQAVFEAAQIQRRLCAPRELNWRQFEFAGEIFPVRHLSGDFFKVVEMQSGLGMALGDIAGKGFTAGIWQAHMMGLVQRSARKHSDVAAAVAEVNEELCSDEGQPPLTALFFAQIDPDTNEIAYCNAGLPAPFIVRGDKSIELLDKGGPMLGAVKNGTFETGQVILNADDMLVAYSDGVTECRNAQDEEFEMNRLTTAARAVAGVAASKALFSLLGTVLDFAESCSPADDITVLVLRRTSDNETESAGSRAKEFSGSDRRTSAAARPTKSERGVRSSK
jgi:serine phosphatase RsbU (regulator of sigma subunit)